MKNLKPINKAAPAMVVLVALCLGQFAAVASSTPEQDHTRMFVHSTYHDPDAGSNVVVLADETRTVYVPIWIGPWEAMAIELALNGIETPRPMTHDLLKSAIETMGGKVDSVIIYKLDEGVFHALIIIRTGDMTTQQLDSRASDAIALAVRCSALIMVSDSVIEETGLRDEKKIKSDI